MSTNLQVITDALRAINVIDETETPSAEQGAHCLRQMNQMIAEWEVDGVRLGYFAQVSTAASCPVPDWAENGVSMKLALRVAAHFGAQVPIGTAAAANDGYETILRTVLNQALEGADMSHLPMGSGRFGYDISAE